MLDFHEKRKLKSWIYSKPTAVLVLIAAVLLSFSVHERYVAERETARKSAERIEELRQLEERASVLDSEVRRLKSERGIEAEIRDRFEVAKKGEQVVIIVGDDEIGTNSEPAAETVEDGESFFDMFKFW